MKNKIKDFTSKLNNPTRATMWYTAASFFEKGCAVLFTPIYTRLLLPTEYGDFALYSSYIGIFSVFITLQLSGSVIYRGLKEFRDRKEFISAAVGLMLVCSSLCVLIYFLFFDFFDNLTGLGALLSALLFLEAALNGIVMIKLSEAKFYYRYRVPAIQSAIVSVFTPIVAVILIKNSSQGELSRIYAHLFISALFAFPMLFTILISARGRVFSISVWRFLLKYAIPSIPHFLSISLIFQIGKISVGRFFDESEVAKLSIATSVGFVPSFFTQGTLSALLPWINRRISDEGGEEKIYSFILTVLSPLSLVVLLFLCFCPEAISIMAPKSYFPALPAVYPIAISSVCTLFINIFSSIISYYKKTYLVTLGSLFGAAVAVFLNFLFTRQYGFVFASFAQLIACISILTVYTVMLKKIFRHSSLSISKLSLPFLSLGIGALVIFYLSHSLFARFIFATAMAFALIPCSKSLLKLLINKNTPMIKAAE